MLNVLYMDRRIVSVLVDGDYEFILKFIPVKYMGKMWGRAAAGVSMYCIAKYGGLGWLLGIEINRVCV